MSRKKQKSSTAPLVDELSGPLREFVNDFAKNGKAVLEQVRTRSPEKYLELSCKLASLVAALEPKASELENAQNDQDIAVALLHNIEMDDASIDDSAIAEAVALNDEFLRGLEAIKAARKRSQKRKETQDEPGAMLRHLERTGQL